MEYVFGPVRSRRLGRSLGIDPIPLKTCNWNCVYCQLGRTVPLTNTRAEYCPTEAVLTELRRALDTSAGIDWITFVGSGEPTLHSRIGWLIRQVKGLVNIPVAVITNGSLLHIPDVAQALAAADAVLPTLDAGDAALYRKLNRPHPALSYDSLRQGEPALQSLAAALDEMEPDEVHINVPFRAPAESWVRVPAPDTLRRTREIIGGHARLIEPASADFETPRTNALDSLTEVVARHPLPDEEVWATFAACGEDPDAAVRELASDKRVARVERQGRWFWCPSRATYAERPGAIQHGECVLRPTPVLLREMGAGHRALRRCATSEDGGCSSRRARPYPGESANGVPRIADGKPAGKPAEIDSVLPQGAVPHDHKKQEPLCCE